MATTPPEKRAEQPAPKHRWLWLFGIWGASVLAIVVLSQIIRWAIMP